MWRLVALLLPLLAARCHAGSIRLNHIQVLHSHNSYHICPLSNMVALFESNLGQSVVNALKESGNSDMTPDAWAYGHAPLIDQVRDLGVRSLEIDIVYDPDGGRYSYRAGPKIADALNVAGEDGRYQGGDLEVPGWKVMHIPDLDFQSSCDGLASCLAPIAAWSQANPTHSPLFITLEFKEWDPSSLISSQYMPTINFLLKLGRDPKGLTSTPTPDASHLTALESEILSVFDRTQILTPDQFRGGYVNLQERITEAGWPQLSTLRGKVIFKVSGSNTYKQLVSTAWPGGMYGLFFIETTVDNVASFDPGYETVFTYADWVSVVDSVNKTALTEAGIVWSTDTSTLTADQWRVVVDLYRQGINQVVSSGKVMVRAAADMATVEARANFRGWGNAAVAGGAHFIHTDYPGGTVSQCSFTSPYTVPLEQAKRDSWSKTTLTSVTTTYWNNLDNTAKLASTCNPVLADKPCTKWALDRQPGKACTCYSLA